MTTKYLPLPYTILDQDKDMTRGMDDLLREPRRKSFLVLRVPSRYQPQLHVSFVIASLLKWKRPVVPFPQKLSPDDLRINAGIINQLKLSRQIPIILSHSLWILSPTPFLHLPICARQNLLQNGFVLLLHLCPPFLLQWISCLVSFGCYKMTCVQMEMQMMPGSVGMKSYFAPPSLGSASSHLTRPTGNVFDPNFYLLRHPPGCRHSS